MTKDELIKKWEDVHKEHQKKHKGELEHFCCYWAVENFIRDLTSLQEPTEREVEIKKIKRGRPVICKSCRYVDEFTEGNSCLECGRRD